MYLASLSLSIIDVWNLILLCSREYPVHCETFSSNPGLYYPLDVGSTTPPLLCNQKISSDIAKLRITAQKEGRKDRQYSQVLEILINTPRDEWVNQIWFVTASTNRGQWI